MDYLADGFVKSGYDMKWLHREIVNSDAYQRSWKPASSNKLDEKNFSRALIRRLPAEVVFDSIAMATASSNAQRKFAGDLAARAIGPNGSIGGRTKGSDDYTLKTFGKPARLANCDCERTSDPTLLQTIFTRNDPSLLALLDSSRRDGYGWITELQQRHAPKGKFGSAEAQLAAVHKRLGVIKPPKTLEAGAGPDKQRRYEGELKRYQKETAEVEKRQRELEQALAKERNATPLDVEAAATEVFLRTVSRPPSAGELANAKEDIAAAKTPVDGVRDLLWAMLNTREFMVNH
jgi:hypothetical protein